jgi:hypothetical protein
MLCHLLISSAHFEGTLFLWNIRNWLIEEMVSYPIRHHIPDGIISHTASYPIWHHIPDLGNWAKGTSLALVKEQGSYNPVQNMGHKGPVLRPRCIGPVGAWTQIPFIHSVIISQMVSYPIRHHISDGIISRTASYLRWYRIPEDSSEWKISMLKFKFSTSGCIVD